MTGARRHFKGSELIVASHNTGKISEIGDLLAPFGIASIGADALGLDEPEETGANFIANAELKARAAAACYCSYGSVSNCFKSNH